MLLVVNRTSVSRAVLSISVIAIVLLALASVLAEFESRWFIFNVIAQFRWEWFCCSLIFLVVFACLRKPWLALVSITIASINLAHTGSLVGTNFRSSSAPNKLRIMQMNVNSRSTEINRVIAYVRKEAPDVFVVEELNPLLRAKIASELPDYKYSIAESMNSPAGIGLFSKYPLQNPRFLDFSGAHRAAVCATICSGTQTLSLVGVHLTGPIKDGSWQIQNLEFKGMANQCRDLAHPLIIAGDFNCVPWTSNFRSTVEALQLADIRHGPGIQATWPSHEPITRLPFVGYKRTYVPILNQVVVLPIDHFLASSDLNITNEFVGPSIGSDHFPLVLDVSLPK